MSDRTLNRREALRVFGAGTALVAGATLPGCSALGGLTGGLTDPAIFNFALNLEYLEAEYYLRATTGRGLADADAGPDAGAVTNAPSGTVRFSNDDFRQFAEELAANELAHVRFYRQTLGDAAVSRPTLDMGAFAAAAQAAGLGSDFDPFASEMNFFLGGMLMEDVGITAYTGAAPLISSKTLLAAAAGVLAVEAYHMGMARSTLYRMGGEAREAARAISDLRDRLDGPGDKDQGLVLAAGEQAPPGHPQANVAVSDANAVGFGRTPQEVLRIVYNAPAAGVSSGGFYPQGMNGVLRTT